jgi:hypothetical protein
MWSWAMCSFFRSFARRWNTICRPPVFRPTSFSSGAIIAAAAGRLLAAGMGDSLAKWYEGRPTFDRTPAARLDGTPGVIRIAQVNVHCCRIQSGLKGNAAGVAFCVLF